LVDDVGVTMAVGAGPVTGAPTGTIGFGGADFAVECAGVGPFRPSGMTMGVGVPAASPAPPPPPSFESEACAGGQSTPVGGQLSPLPDPDVSPGGGQPDPAPNSPAPEQSASATPSGTTASHPMTSHEEHAATATHRRQACRR
jgi:hypothetical protein